MTDQPVEWARADDLVTLDELAERIKVAPRSWLNKEARAGRLPSMKVGSRRVYSVAAVEMELRRQASVCQKPEPTRKRVRIEKQDDGAEAVN